MILQSANELGLADRITGTDTAVIGALFFGTILLTRLIRPILRAVLTWLARRSLTAGTGRWRVRVDRGGRETAEQSALRREQRIAATATGLARVVNTLLWILALLLVLGRLEVDPVFAVSAAGFIGVAISIGGQHSVNDFLTGLQILLEDRFGEGDELKLKVHDDVLMASVVYLGAFTTRLQSEDATFHIPNREMTMVVNLSQQGTTTEVKFETTDQLPATGTKNAVEAAVRKRYRQSAGFDASRDGLVIDQLEATDDGYTLKIRTARPLTRSQHQALALGSTAIPDAPGPQNHHQESERQPDEI